jgi:glutaredoxin
MQKQKFFTALVVIVILVLLGAIVFSSNSLSQNNSQENKMDQPITNNKFDHDLVIFSAENCPYCKEVEEWIKENSVDEKLDIAIKEVSSNREYSKELEQAAISCRINPTQVGVPLMFAQKECYSGKIEIIDYLQEQVGQTQEEADSVEEQADLTQEQEGGLNEEIAE